MYEDAERYKLRVSCILSLKAAALRVVGKRKLPLDAAMQMTQLDRFLIEEWLKRKILLPLHLLAPHGTSARSHVQQWVKCLARRVLWQEDLTKSSTWSSSLRSLFGCSWGRFSQLMRCHGADWWHQAWFSRHNASSVRTQIRWALQKRSRAKSRCWLVRWFHDKRHLLFPLLATRLSEAVCRPLSLSAKRKRADCISAKSWRQQRHTPPH